VTIQERAVLGQREAGPFPRRRQLEGRLEAALQGCGIAVLPEPIAAAFVARGDLVQVLPGAVGSDVRVSVVYAERTFVPAPVRVFIDAMVAWGATGLFESTPDYAVLAPPRKARRRPR